MRAFAETLELVYCTPKVVTFGQAQHLLVIANNFPSEISGEAWIALALLQNLCCRGLWFAELPPVEVCCLHAIDKGFCEAHDLLYELRLDSAPQFFLFRN